MAKFNIKDSGQEHVNNEIIDETPNYIAASLIGLLFCFPVGIFAVAFSILTVRAKNNRDASGAKKNSDRALMAIGLSFVLGLVVALGYIVYD